MVIIRLMGGLGNQMQQYALYRKFISLGKEAYLDTSWYDGVSGDGTTVRKLEIDHFALADYQTANRASVARFTGSGNLFAKIRNRLIPSASRYIRESAPYQPGIFERDDCLFEGYWSADKYYADIADDLRRCFSFEPMLDRDSDKKAQIAKIRTAIDEAPVSCSVHIRRGDYLKPGIAEEFGGIATEEYYDSAFGYVRERHPDVRFFVFSDDPGYVADRYGSDISCVSVDINHGDDSLYDIYLMSLCNAHICANSSFSFWGARLDKHRDDALCIRPDRHMNSKTYDMELMHYLWPEWILIDPDGRIR